MGCETRARGGGLGCRARGRGSWSCPLEFCRPERCQGRCSRRHRLWGRTLLLGTRPPKRKDSHRTLLESADAFRPPPDQGGVQCVEVVEDTGRLREEAVSCVFMMGVCHYSGTVRSSKVVVHSAYLKGFQVDFWGYI